MKSNKRLLMSLIWLILGMILFPLGLTGSIDSYWSGLGTALLTIGILQLLRYHRLLKNETYREKMEIELSDERNRYLRAQAWSWAGYLFVLIVAVASLVLQLFGQELLSSAASCAICLMLLLYCISYLVLKKKY